MKPKKILFLCDEADLDVVERSFTHSDAYSPTVETTEKILDYGVRPYLQRTAELINLNPEMYDGVVGTHDSSAVFASVLCEKTGHTFASMSGVINCQNKYISRLIQREILPEHTPKFALAFDYLKNPEQLPSPVFIKPVRANISFGSHMIRAPEELEHYIGRETTEIEKQNRYFLEALSLCPYRDNPLNSSTCNHFLCEEFIAGTQVTVDGFVFAGKVSIFGLTRAVFHEGSNSFSHHEFPFETSPELEEKIRSGIAVLIPGLGIENSFFNVEIRIDEKLETYLIIEVNCRIAFQFAKTIESVRGFDPLHLLCDVATGTRPDLSGTDGQRSPYCYNFELHAFTDQRILKTPTQSVYEAINLHYPDVCIRNLIQEKRKLSDYKHNPESFRYCVLDIPGESREEIMRKYRHIVSMLGYEFGPVTDG
jgi:hypothetical protein